MQHLRPLEAKYTASPTTPSKYLLHDELLLWAFEELLTSGHSGTRSDDFSCDLPLLTLHPPTHCRCRGGQGAPPSTSGASEDTIRAAVGIDGDNCSANATTRRTTVPVAARPRPEPGQGCRRRGSTWAVANVQPGLPLQPGGDHAAAKLNHVVDLQSVDEDRLGEQLSVIWG